MNKVRCWFEKHKKKLFGFGLGLALLCGYACSVFLVNAFDSVGVSAEGLTSERDNGFRFVSRLASETSSNVINSVKRSEDTTFLYSSGTDDSLVNPKYSTFPNGGISNSFAENVSLRYFWQYNARDYLLFDLSSLDSSLSFDLSFDISLFSSSGASTSKIFLYSIDSDSNVSYLFFTGVYNPSNVADFAFYLSYSFPDFIKGGSKIYLRSSSWADPSTATSEQFYSLKFNASFFCPSLGNYLSENASDLNSLVSDYDSTKKAIVSSYNSLYDDIINSIPSAYSTYIDDRVSSFDSYSLLETFNAYSTIYNQYQNYLNYLYWVQVYQLNDSCKNIGLSYLNIKAPLPDEFISWETLSSYLDTLSGYVANANLGQSDNQTIYNLNQQIVSLNQDLTNTKKELEMSKNTILRYQSLLESSKNDYSTLKTEYDSLKNSYDSLASGKYTFTSLFWGVANTPFSFLNSMLNFEFMGINILGLVTGLFTAALAIAVVRKFI